jgi:hypothetical protein
VVKWGGGAFRVMVARGLCRGGVVISLVCMRVAESQLRAVDVVERRGAGTGRQADGYCSNAGHTATGARLRTTSRCRGTQSVACKPAAPSAAGGAWGEGGSPGEDRANGGGGAVLDGGVEAVSVAQAQQGEGLQLRGLGRLGLEPGGVDG